MTVFFQYTFIKNTIELLGMIVLKLKTEKTGFELFIKEKPHVIICDIQMPELSGLKC